MGLTMNPLLFSCSGNRPLAEAVATVLGLKVGDCILERFPDSEMRVEVLEDVHERDVYLIQSMRPPAEQYLLELLLLADACLRAGALRVVVVHKSRLSGTDVAVQGVVGTVRGCSPIIVDDMISTGGTIEAAIRALVDVGCTQEITVSVTHPLLVVDAIERLG